jgi:two-component system, NarL family, sensor histidine kinase DegS
MDPPLHIPWGGGLFLIGEVRSEMAAGRRVKPAVHDRPSTSAPASARDDERRRLARDLHDGPAQTLAAALFGVDLAVSAIDHSPATAREELLAARTLVRDALDDVRALMAGLRPRLLEERGLVAALHALAAMPPLWGTEVVVETEGIGEEKRLPAEVELALFRIAQEAVSNARRHGAASRAQVSLTVMREIAQLLVVDDGRGFLCEPGIAWSSRGEGLPGMRERAELLGGKLRVESAPGAGTRIEVTLPVPLSLHVPRGSAKGRA